MSVVEVHGVNRNNLYQELKFHHQMAIKTALRLLGCAAHNVTIASTEHIQMISDEGYVGLDKVLEKYRADLDISE